jgi:hypothetical protein
MRRELFSENLKGTKHLKNLDIDGRMILISILRKRYMRVGMHLSE